MKAFVVFCSLVLCFTSFASVSAVRDEGVLKRERAGYPAVAVAGESLKNGTPPPPETRGYGIVLDVSQPTSVEQWECLNNHFGGQLHGVIVRAWRSVGEFDPNALETIRNAKSAGITRVDVYMFPCIHVSILRH